MQSLRTITDDYQHSGSWHRNYQEIKQEIDQGMKNIKDSLNKRRLDCRMPTGGTGGSLAAEDYNNDLYIPLSTCNQYIGSKVSIRSAGSRSAEQVEIYQVTMTVDAEVDTAAGRQTVKAIGDQIKRLLEKHHDKKDWAVTIPLDRLEDAERQQERFTSLLVLIAADLAAGRRHRDHEHHARDRDGTDARDRHPPRAAAKQRDITAQFLVEATVQTTVGGLIGVVVGLLLVFLVPIAPGGLAWVAESVSLVEYATWLRTINAPGDGERAVDLSGRRRFGRCGRTLRLVPRPPRREARPDRSPAAHVVSPGGLTLRRSPNRRVPTITG